MKLSSCFLLDEHPLVSLLGQAGPSSPFEAGAASHLAPSARFLGLLVPARAFLTLHTLDTTLLNACLAPLTCTQHCSFARTSQ